MNELIIAFCLYGLSVIFTIFVLRRANELVISFPDSMFHFAIAFIPLINIGVSFVLILCDWKEFFDPIWKPFYRWFYCGEKPKFRAFYKNCNENDDFGGRY